ncbi:MAG TPA: amidohydrolase/deacetylase family metallohydrolase, partial [Spirochaetes bacterium]|nr:amidohydrolase/deacetylase family metallohydrolase [Spirochaetota bacterium]
MALIIKNGRVLDPASGMDAVKDILVSGGRIVKIETDIPHESGSEIIDAGGCIVLPGLI